jgi:mannose-6-phosphate isomerase-like protein (cupin superfamily)
MKRMDRRQLCAVLPALAAVGASASFGQEPAAPASPQAGGGTLGAARVIPLEQMQEHKTASGEGWSIAHGTLATGETVNLHQSMQEGSAPPVQLHVIQHTEFILVREGEVEFQHEADGKVVAERAGAGAVLYIPIGTKHAIRNVGTVPARYFVVGIGGDAK